MLILPANLRCGDCGLTITVRDTSPSVPDANRIIGKCGCGEADITDALKQIGVQIIPDKINEQFAQAFAAATGKVK